MAATVAAGLLAVFAGAWLAGRPLDREWSLALNSGLSGWPTFWSFLTWSGLGACGFLLLCACSSSEPRRVAGLLVALVIGGLLVHVLKRTLQIERPLAVFGAEHPVFSVIGESLHKGSMPSGHSATAWAVAGLLVLSESRASVWRHLWWVLATCQAVSRIVVGAHWPSDVLVGSGMGVMLAPVVWRLGVTGRLSQWLHRPEARLFMAGSLPVWGLVLCLSDLGWPLPAWAISGVMALSLWGAWRWWHSARQPSAQEAAA